jgi:IclR family acetate operon transcriptional repressor
MAKTNARPGPIPVQSVGRSLDLLEAVAEEELGLVALAERAGLGASTAYRLLSTLVERGYVARSEETGRFRLGHKLVELASAARQGNERLRAAIRPHLRALRDATGETANLVVLDGLSIVYVDQVESSRAVRMFTTIGRRVPLHASGGGKAIAAFAPPELLAELIANGLEPLTPRTLASARALRADLAAVRERGYAIDNEEYEAGVICVAAPIFGPDGEAVAAASISGPAARMQEHDLDALGAIVREHTRRASTEAGAGADAGGALAAG